MFSKSLATQSYFVWTKYHNFSTCPFFWMGFWILCLLIINTLLTWSYSRGHKLTSKKRESNSCEENSGLTHHGNYTYAVICQLWIRMEEDSKLSNPHFYYRYKELVSPWWTLLSIHFSHLTFRKCNAKLWISFLFWELQLSRLKGLPHFDSLSAF